VTRRRIAILPLAATPALAPMPLPPADADIDRRIAALHIRAGSPADLRERDRALAWLLERPDRSFPLVLQRAAAAPQDRVLIDLLGRFRRAEATALLRQAFAAAHTRAQAAAGLGLSPDPAARAALRHALGSTDSAEVVAALAGLGASGDPAACADIVPRLEAVDAEVRWMAVEAGSRLGCLDGAVLQAIARDDPDAAVRALAAEKSR
jgi:hypothetical protein